MAFHDPIALESLRYARTPVRRGRIARALVALSVIVALFVGVRLVQSRMHSVATPPQIPEFAQPYGAHMLLNVTDGCIRQAVFETNSSWTDTIDKMGGQFAARGWTVDDTAYGRLSATSPDRGLWITYQMNDPAQQLLALHHVTPHEATVVVVSLSRCRGRL